jgi:acyl carrier protein
MVNELEKKVKISLKGFLNLEQPLERIKLEDNLIYLGLTSMDFIKWAVELENEFGIEFGEEDLYLNKYNNLGSLISFIESKVNQTH